MPVQIPAIRGLHAGIAWYFVVVLRLYPEVDISGHRLCPLHHQMNLRTLPRRLLYLAQLQGLWMEPECWVGYQEQWCSAYLRVSAAPLLGR